MVGDKVKKMKVPAKGGVSAEEGIREIEAYLKAVSPSDILKGEVIWLLF
jgi:hypothetical protein